MLHLTNFRGSLPIPIKMSVKNRSEQLNVWRDIGYYPTPSTLVKEFSIAFEQFLNSLDLSTVNPSRQLRVADIFAGDGRLGRAIVERISPCCALVPHLTYVESDSRKFSVDRLRHGSEAFLLENAFLHNPGRLYDIVVGNPPFLSLNAATARKFGLPWDVVNRKGRNLYGLALSHAIQICRPGGIVAFICPFGWLQGAFGYELRRTILEKCDKAIVRALSSRLLFSGAQQDVAFHFFRKATHESGSKLSSILFSIDGKQGQQVSLYAGKFNHNAKEVFRVRVGAVVWNRSRSSLTGESEGRLPIVYGGNIAENDKLCFLHDRYRHRQYVRNGASLNDLVSCGPAILLRRVLRGRPGNWKIDSVVISKARRVVVENHVIIVQLPAHFTLQQGRHLRSELATALLESVASLGSPNLSVDLVHRALLKIVV